MVRVDDQKFDDLVQAAKSPDSEDSNLAEQASVAAEKAGPPNSGDLSVEDAPLDSYETFKLQEAEKREKQAAAKEVEKKLQDKLDKLAKERNIRRGTKKWTLLEAEIFGYAKQAVDAAIFREQTDTRSKEEKSDFAKKVHIVNRKFVNGGMSFRDARLMCDGDKNRARVMQRVERHDAQRKNLEKPLTMLTHSNAERNAVANGESVTRFTTRRGAGKSRNRFSRLDRQTTPDVTSSSDEDSDEELDDSPRGCIHAAMGLRRKKKPHAQKVMQKRQTKSEKNNDKCKRIVPVGNSSSDDNESLATRLEWNKEAAARQEAARQEAARQEAARQEAARQEAARQEAARQEAARQEAARQEAARQEAARQEAARQEAARQEAEQRASDEDKKQKTTGNNDKKRKRIIPVDDSSSDEDEPLATILERNKEAAARQEAARQEAEQRAKARHEEVVARACRDPEQMAAAANMTPEQRRATFKRGKDEEKLLEIKRLKSAPFYTFRR